MPLDGWDSLAHRASPTPMPYRRQSASGILQHDIVGTVIPVLLRDSWHSFLRSGSPWGTEPPPHQDCQGASSSEVQMTW